MNLKSLPVSRLDERTPLADVNAGPIKREIESVLVDMHLKLLLEPWVFPVVLTDHGI